MLSLLSLEVSTVRTKLATGPWHHPFLTERHAQQSARLVSSDKWDAAIDDLNKAISLDSENELARLILAQCKGEQR